MDDDGQMIQRDYRSIDEARILQNETKRLEMQLFPQTPLPAPHRTTGLQIITGDYRLTMTHCRQITGIYLAFTIKDVYRYWRFPDKAGLFTVDYRR